MAIGPDAESERVPIEEGLKSELAKQGVVATSLQELYNWGRKNSLLAVELRPGVLRHRDDCNDHGAL